MRSVTIRLAPVLPTTVASVNFPNVKKATEAVVEVLSRGVGIRMLFLSLLRHITYFFPRMRRAPRRQIHGCA